VRRQSEARRRFEAAQALEEPLVNPAEGGVALRLPPQSKPDGPMLVVSKSRPNCDALAICAFPSFLFAIK